MIFKIDGKNSLKEMFKYLSYVSSLSNISDKSALAFSQTLVDQKEDLLQQISTSSNDTWLSYKLSDSYSVDYIIQQGIVTFKTNYWFKQIEVI